MRLSDFAGNVFSQFGEDLMLAHVLERIGVRHKACVEFGANDGSSCSNTARLWREEGWRAVLIESDHDRFAELEGNARLFDTVCLQAHVTPTGPCSVAALVAPHAAEVDVMSIDVDGDDFLILERVQKPFRPRVIIVEFNPTVPPHLELYPAELGGTFGASLLAIVRLAERLSYRFIGATHCNAFLVDAAEREIEPGIFEPAPAAAFDDYETDPTVLCPLDRYTYALTDLEGRVVLGGQPLPWDAKDPYVLPVAGAPLVPATNSAQQLRRGFESLWGPALWLSTSYFAAPTVENSHAKLRDVLRDGRPPLVCIDLSNEPRLTEVDWMRYEAAAYNYRPLFAGRVLGLIANEGDTVSEGMSVTPLVSIVILNWQHEEIIDVCLRTLAMTEGVPYEVVVVDNGSEPEVVKALHEHRDEGRITTLVEEPVNHYFSEGNNIGVRNTNPASQYILLLNSDVAFLRGDWLVKLIAWMEGTIKYWPSVWGLKPAEPTPGPRDIVSAGFAYDTNVLPGKMRPEGFCCLIRRSVWVDLSPDLPWHGGFEEAIATAVRAGAKCGVLSQYPPYLVHREGGSAPGTWRCDNGAKGEIPVGFENKRNPDIPAFFNGLDIETLDFALGPSEHESYLAW